MNVTPHIVSDPDIRGGEPVLVGTRISVAQLIADVAVDGVSLTAKVYGVHATNLAGMMRDVASAFVGRIPRIDAREQAEREEDARFFNEGLVDDIICRASMRWSAWISARDVAERRVAELEAEIKCLTEKG